MTFSSPFSSTFLSTSSSRAAPFAPSLANFLFPKSDLNQLHPSVIDVLVIDDDPVMLTSLHRLLQKRGYRVTTASDAAAGLKTAIRLVPSVIICDWLLTGDLDGIDICQYIKQDPQLSTTTFLIMTGHTDIANRVEALEAGADDLLIKPVDTAALIARVNSGMRLHQLTQALRAQTHRLQSELAEAATYVMSLLPADIPKPKHSPNHGAERDLEPKPESSGVAISSRFISSQELGGDCFDHYWLDPDCLVMYLLDVSGHGLGAALLSTSVLNVLRSQSLPGVNFYRPETVLKGLNEAFQMSAQNDKYFTIWYGVYNRISRELAYASAGHPPALLMSPTAQNNAVEIQRLRTAGMPIGMMPNTLYQWQRCAVPADSRLYIFSDGIYEIKPEIRTETQPVERDRSTPHLLGLDNFVTLLTQLAAQEQLSLDTILHRVAAFSGNQFDDDLSLLEIDFYK